jgi:hypothetical protein
MCSLIEVIFIGYSFAVPLRHTVRLDCSFLIAGTARTRNAVMDDRVECVLVPTQKWSFPDKPKNSRSPRSVERMGKPPTKKTQLSPTNRPLQPLLLRHGTARLEGGHSFLASSSISSIEPTLQRKRSSNNDLPSFGVQPSSSSTSPPFLFFLLFREDRWYGAHHRSLSHHGGVRYVC